MRQAQPHQGLPEVGAAASPGSSTPHPVICPIDHSSMLAGVKQGVTGHQGHNIQDKVIPIFTCEPRYEAASLALQWPLLRRARKQADMQFVSK